MPPTDSEDTFYSISHRYESVGYFMCRKLLRDVDFFSIEFTYSSEYSLCVDCYELDMSILYCYIQSTVTVITTKVSFFYQQKNRKKGENILLALSTIFEFYFICQTDSKCFY